MKQQPLPLPKDAYDERLGAALAWAKSYHWAKEPYICGICKAEHSGPHGRRGFNRGLGRDHDHRTGHARGFLCNHCNLGLGHFRDDIKLLRAAIRYLKRFKRRYFSPAGG